MIELTIKVNPTKAETPPDEWSSVHDVCDAFQDGVIVDGEVTNYTFKG